MTLEIFGAPGSSGGKSLITNLMLQVLRLGVSAQDEETLQSAHPTAEPLCDRDMDVAASHLHVDMINILPDCPPYAA